jgi:glycosyltransferase involved in cell wall biosynthesis
VEPFVSASCSALKIAYVIDTLACGGSQRLLVDIATRLNREHFTPRVFALTASGVLEKRLHARAVPVSIYHKAKGMDFRVIPKLAHDLKAWQPDVVHTFLFTANSFGRVAALLARVPLIIGTEHCYCQKSRFRIWIDRVLAKFTDRIVVVTKEIAEQVVGEYQIASSKVVMIEEGIDFAEFFPRLQLERRTRVAAGRPRLGIVARLEPQKDHQTFLAAMALVLSKQPAAEVWVVGDGYLRAELTNQVRAAGIAEQVKFLGFREDLPDVLRNLDVFVVSSQWEGLPIALLNAIATELPFVSTAVGGIREMFADGEHGRLVAPGSPSALAGAVDWVLGHYLEAESMAASAKQKIMGTLSVERMIADHEKLYQQLFAEQKPRA